MGAGGQYSLTASITPADSGNYTWEVLGTQQGDDSTIIQQPPATSFPSCAGLSTCAATLQGSSNGGKATVRVHFTDTVTGGEVTADSGLIVVQIQKVDVSVPASVGGDPPTQDQPPSQSASFRPRCRRAPCNGLQTAHG